MNQKSNSTSTGTSIRNDIAEGTQQIQQDICTVKRTERKHTLNTADSVEYLKLMELRRLNDNLEDISKSLRMIIPETGKGGAAE